VRVDRVNVRLTCARVSVSPAIKKSLTVSIFRKGAAIFDQVRVDRPFQANQRLDRKAAQGPPPAIGTAWLLVKPKPTQVF
jgi:hypothetical protein